MELPIPPPPVRLGCSRPVQRRVRQSGPMVRAAFALLAVLDEALERQYGDRLERDRQLRARGLAAEGGKKPITVRDLVYNIGLEVQRLAVAMVDADEALADAHGCRRGACTRRETARKRLYHQLSRFRRNARGILRSRPPIPAILQGETVRDPWLLAGLAAEILTWAEARQDPPPGADSWEALAAPVEPPRAELTAALREVTAAEPAIVAGRDELERVIAAFDFELLHGGRVCERFCRLVGLPSLAGAFRPHLEVAGRVGRSSKQAEVDDHPDLVARFHATLAAGCVVLGKPGRRTTA